MPVTFYKVVNSQFKDKLREIKDHSKHDFRQQWFGACLAFGTQKDYLKFTIEHNTAEYAIENYPTVPRELIR